MRLLRFEDHMVVPWKNGGGLTREIIVHRDAAIHPDFLWRISMATIDRPGPFSRFGGIDRTIAVLSGEGVRLLSDAEETVLTPQSQPYRFSGETQIDSTPLLGETTDLNVMTRRGFFTHTVRRVVIDGETSIETDGDETILFFNGAVTVANAPAPLAARAMDALRGIEKGARLSLSAQRPETVFIIGINSSDAR